MSAVLDRAKSIERQRSNEASLTIPLSLLQDLIAEIERLEAERPLKAMAEKLKERAP